VDPAQLAQYFVSRASAPLKGGTEVEWEFADVAPGLKLKVSVYEVEKDQLIIFDWGPSQTRARVTIRLRAEGAGATIVSINESRFPMDREGVGRALGQNAGWTYFLCCLKAWVTHGVNLRKGVIGPLTATDEVAAAR